MEEHSSDELDDEEEEQHNPTDEHINESEAIEDADKDKLVESPPAQVIAVTPAHTIPISKAMSKTTQHIKDDGIKDSDDEICGPVTPMRRGFTPAKLRQAQPFESVSRRLQTPAKRPVTFSVRRDAPQTQKLPIRALASYYPPRPVTVSRDSSRSYVVPALEQPAQLQSESSGICLMKDDDNIHVRVSPVDPEIDDELTDAESISSHGLSGSDSEPENREESNDAEEEAVRSQIAKATEDDMLDEESDHDKQREQNYELDIQELTQSTGEGVPFESQLIEADTGEQAYFDTDSEDELQHFSEDEDEEDLIADQNDPANESNYEQEDDYPSDDDEQSDNDSTIDDTIIKPQLPADLMRSSPVLPAPTASDETELNFDDSEVLSSVPSTPTSVIVRNLKEDDNDDESSDEEPAPSPRASLSDDSTLPEFDDQGDTTPWKTRVSFNTATAQMLQTPNMRAFRSEKMMIMESCTSSNPATETDPTCIDPALLAEQDDGVSLALEADIMAGVASEELIVDFTAATRGTTLIHSQLPEFDTPRMSLLEESILIEPADPGFSLSTVSDEQAPITAESMDEEPAADQLDIATPRLVQNWNAREFVNEAATPLPSYARSTVSTNLRRQTMAGVRPATPCNETPRPRAADTVIKPAMSGSFAKTLASKNNHTPTAVPSTRTPSTHKPTPTPTHRKPAPIILAQPATPITPFTGPRLRKHTPTPLSQTPIKASFKSPIKASLKSPIKTSVRTSIKTPLKTPIKTPLKPPGGTPAAYPMTPHPAQPLRAITALVEIYTLDGSSASTSFIDLLHRLGARTTKTWSDRITHVIFKDGSPTTLQKVRLANKAAAAAADNETQTNAAEKIFCVNSRWVTDCDREGRRQDERDERYAVDVTEIPRGGRRRRKSMEPLASLRNLNGNVVVSATTPPRAAKCRPARQSIASTVWGGSSPVKGGAGAATPGDEENWDDSVVDIDGQTLGFDDEEQEEEEEERVRGLQMTAPVKRVKALKLKGEGSRRLTFFPARGAGDGLD